MIAPKVASTLAKEPPHEDGGQRVMRLVVNEVAAARGLDAPWPDVDADLPPWLAEADVSGWGVAELGAAREQLLAAEDRDATGAWYTPPPAADFVTLAALGMTTPPTLADAPAAALAPSVIDPACGAGVFLLAAARELAWRYAAVLTGSQDPPAHVTAIVLPLVMRECVYGIDIDPVAVDLARSACWLETGGMAPSGWMDDNIVVGDPLAGDLPPRLAERLAGPGPLLIVGNPPYRDKAKGAAPWIEARRPKRPKDRTPDELWRPSMDEFRKPGNGRREYVLSNLAVYFWRWALWRALEARTAPGVVAFISPSAYLASDAFAGMREHIRRTADVGYIVNLSPEGHQPKASTRVFPGVQQPLAISLFARLGAPDPTRPAHIRATQVTGDQAEKFRQLHDLLRPQQGAA